MTALLHLGCKDGKVRLSIPQVALLYFSPCEAIGSVIKKKKNDINCDVIILTPQLSHVVHKWNIIRENCKSEKIILKIALLNVYFAAINFNKW